MKLELQYISDIHLEFRKEYTINPIAPNLALCGDIGWPESIEYMNFIEDCSNKFKNVFVIFGNHEYYNSRENEIKLTMLQKRKFTKYFPRNVYFLNNSSVYLNLLNNKVYLYYKKNCIKIIGSTLWTNIDFKTSLLMNDYNYIYFKKNKLIKRKNVVQMFNTSKEYILKELNKEPNVKCILLTHHGSNPVFFGNNRNESLYSAYVNSIPELYVKNNLIICISGHSHSSIEQHIYFQNHRILFLSNQLGYPGEKITQTQFNENKKLEYTIDLN